MIHIVCRRIDKDRVLPRLARALAKSTGWSVSEIPLKGAKLNYFFPYLELQNREWAGVSAAWFTHKDTKTPAKEAVWNDVAGRVDLRTLTAGIYKEDLKQYGPVHIVKPVVELDHFTPVKNKRGRIVGVSGWLYGDGRKGEDLVAQLTTSKLDCKWRASGRGWSIPTRCYTWENLPKFFQSLDLFVCASRIEGVPMPPLEALACGIPVVIPHGVGMLDDLPDIPGITRFKRGSYKSLHLAIKKALDLDYDREQLRDSVLQYNDENWANDHKEAFNDLLSGTKPYTQPGKGKQGMYCVAFGEPSRACATRLIKSFKKYMPDTPAMFVGTKPLEAGEDIFKQHKDIDVGGRIAKLAVDKMVPKDWEYVLYLDADTEVMEPIQFLYDTLRKGWEFLICKDMHERHWLAKMRRGDNDDECNYTEELVGTDQVMQYNGGVFAYRRTLATKRFFELWNTEYQKWHARDQGGLIRAIHTQPLRMMVLCNQWNASDRYELPPGPIAIIHHNVQARRWSRSIAGRIDGKDAWRAVEEWERANLKSRHRNPFSSKRN